MVAKEKIETGLLVGGSLAVVLLIRDVAIPAIGRLASSVLSKKLPSTKKAKKVA